MFILYENTEIGLNKKYLSMTPKAHPTPLSPNNETQITHIMHLFIE